MQKQSGASQSKSLLTRALYALRDLRSRRVFSALATHCGGDVLDVGGWDFFLTVRSKQIPFERWTCLEIDPRRTLDLDDPRFKCMHGDGCAMDFPDESYDTVISMQVLEHVFEPLRMMDEMARVLRPGGHLVLLVPQTANLHLLPHHYQNFTRSWVLAAAERTGLEVVSLEAMGGAFSTIASRLFYFFLQAFRADGYVYPEGRRPVLFYPLLPLMLLYAAVNIPACMLLSLGDLDEEPNNHLAVLRKAP